MRRAFLVLLLVGCRRADDAGDRDTDGVDSDVADTDVVDSDVVDSDTDDTDGVDSDTDVVDRDTDDTDGAHPEVACGEETCDGAAAYCLTSLPGQPPDTADTAGPPDFTECVALPAACLDDVSCDCLVTSGAIPGFADCRGDDGSGLSVTIAYP